MLKIRGHHLLCIPRFYSGGYNSSFAKHHKKLCALIRKNPDIKLKIIEGCDALCLKCPYISNGKCIKDEFKNNERVLSFDRRVMKKLAIKSNSTFTAREIFNKSITKIPNLRDIDCNNCRYYDSCLKTEINNAFTLEINA